MTKDKFIWVLKLIRWILDFCRLGIVGVQTMIDATITAIEGKPRKN